MNNLRHVAIIMDGNGRWAKKHFLPRIEGHRRGLSVAERIISHSLERNIKFLSLFVFSTENWKRPNGEVSSLFSLAEKYVSKLDEFCKDGIRIVVSGEMKGLPDSLMEKIRLVCERTKNNDAICVNLCINYGGQAEIVHAAKALAESGRPITIEGISENLYNPFIPAPDMIVRTGGQIRLSNFLLFQSAYSELFFVDTLWPDFSNAEYDSLIEEYSARTRNFGGLKND